MLPHMVRLALTPLHTANRVVDFLEGATGAVAEPVAVVVAAEHLVGQGKDHGKMGSTFQDRKTPVVNANSLVADQMILQKRTRA